MCHRYSIVLELLNIGMHVIAFRESWISPFLNAMMSCIQGEAAMDKRLYWPSGTRMGQFQRVPTTRLLPEQLHAERRFPGVLPGARDMLSASCIPSQWSNIFHMNLPLRFPWPCSPQKSKPILGITQYLHNKSLIIKTGKEFLLFIGCF